MSVWTKSPSKGMTGRKQKLAGAKVRTVVKESIETGRGEGKEKVKRRRTKQTEGGHDQVWP